MRITFFAVAAFVAMLAMPLGAYAQANQPAAARSSSHTNPSPAKLQHRWTKRFGHLNLSGDQQQRVQSIINQYSQAHPQGSPRDPGSARELRHQLMGVLSSDQQNQFRQEMQARRAQMRQRYGQMQQGGAQNDQGAPDQRYQQGPDQQTSRVRAISSISKVRLTVSAGSASAVSAGTASAVSTRTASAVSAGTARSAVSTGTASTVSAGTARSTVSAGSANGPAARLTACLKRA